MDGSENEGTEAIGLEYVSSLSIRDSARAGKNRILKRRVCILRTIAGTVRVSGEKMTAGRSI